MDKVLQSLEILLSNAKKSLGKPYTRETIEKKKLEIVNLQTDFNELVEKEKLEDSVKYKTRFSELKAEVLSLLLEHSELAQQVKEKDTVKQDGN